MKQELKILIAIGVGVLVIGGGALLFFKGNSASNPGGGNQPAPESLLIHDTDHIQKAPNQKHTLVEFGDYQCPACSVANPIINKALAAHKDSVTFVFRHFPLSQHPNAIPAGLAAEAAGRQGKFWEMHDLLYEKQSEWAEKSNAQGIFLGFAKDLNLDADKFKSALADSKLRDKILADQADGNRLAINATPTLYLDGQKVEFRTLQDLKDQLSEKLK